MASKNIFSFGSGEVDERLIGRPDVGRYFNACKQLQNYFVGRSGYAEFRAGTQYIASTKDSTKSAVVIPFTFSVSVSYILEFGDLYIRFYRDGAQLGAPYEVVSPYLSTELSLLKYKQSADVMYLHHPNHKTRLLSRLGDTNWTLTEEVNKRGPFLSVNEDDSLTITPSYPAWSSTSYTEDDIVTVSGSTLNPPEYSATSNTLLATSSAVNISGDIWEFTTTTNHGFTAGNGVNIVGTTKHDGDHIIESTPAANTFRIENPSGSADGPFAGSEVVTEVAVPVNKGAGLVGIPIVGHGLSTDDYVQLAGFVNAGYNGQFELHETTSANEIVIIATYVLEYFDGTETINQLTFYKALSDGSHAVPPNDNWQEAVTFTGTNMTLTASSALFNSGHVGTLWKIVHPRKTAGVSGEFSSAQSSDWIRVSKGTTVALTTTGTWSGVMELQRSFDDGATIETLKVYRSKAGAERNITINTEELDGDALYRVSLKSVVGDFNFDLNVDEFRIVGIVEITAFTSTTQVTATVLEAVGNVTATNNWSEGAWSDSTSPLRAWPYQSEFFDNRRVYGGADGNPTTLWATKSDDLDNFDEGILDDDAFIRTLDGDQINKIQWLYALEDLIIATSGGIWRMNASDLASVMSPTNVRHRRQNTNGAADVLPAELDGALIYVSFGGCKIYELLFDANSETYVPRDLTFLSAHFTEDYTIQQILVVKEPQPVIYARRSDGVVLVGTRNSAEDLMGWSRLVTDGVIESMAMIPGTMEDEVWFIVNRTINGSTARYVERKRPQNYGFSDIAGAWFLDSALEADYGAAAAVSNIANTNPVTVDTSTAHGLSSGHFVRIRNVVGATEANDVFKVVRYTATEFALQDPDDSTNIDGAGWGTYVSGGTAERVEKTFTVSHLDGETVNVLNDGMEQIGLTVSSSQVTLDDYGNRVILGLPYTGIIEPLPPDFERGPLAGLRSRISRVLVRLYRSMGLKIGGSVATVIDQPMRENTDLVDTPSPLISETVPVNLDGAWSRNSNLVVVHDRPLPQTVVSIRLEIDA